MELSSKALMVVQYLAAAFQEISYAATVTKCVNV